MLAGLVADLNWAVHAMVLSGIQDLSAAVAVEIVLSSLLRPHYCGGTSVLQSDCTSNVPACRRSSDPWAIKRGPAATLTLTRHQ